MKKRNVIILIIAAALVVLAAVVFYIGRTHRITDVYVDGNIHYTDEEIAQMVLKSKLDYNSLVLSFKYRNKSVTGIPFVEKMDVSILSPTAVRINVYEKALAGYISYLDRYLYFDREGILVESSDKTTREIPLVMGLDFKHAVLYERLPVENEAVFSTILDVTQLLNKYELQANRISFDAAYNLYLYFEEVEVTLGGFDNETEDKIIRLQRILPSLSGRKGILNMRDYDRNTNNITFEEID